MAEAGAVVDVVGVQQGADELLEDVVVLVGGLGAGIAGDGVAAVVVADAHQFVGHQVERLVPCGLAPDGLGAASFVAVGADERGAHAAGVLDVVGAIAPLDAQHAVVGGHAKRRFDGVDVVILDLQVHLAAHAAVGACRTDNSVGDDHGRVSLLLALGQEFLNC